MSERGRAIAIDYRRSRRHGLRLSFDPIEDCFRLDHGGVSRRAIDRFLAERELWMRSVLAKYGPLRPLAPGAVIPVGDAHLTIAMEAAARANPERQGDRLIVAGPADLVPSRVRCWLKAQCRGLMREHAERHAAVLGAEIGQLRIKEVKSRWGSCRQTGPLAGNLNFSWRLVFAPHLVQDYLAAHEVAHLKYPNHSAEFWSLCRSLCPTTDAAERWLKANGAGLMRYR